MVPWAQIIKAVVGTGMAVAPYIAASTSGAAKAEKVVLKDDIARIKQNRFGIDPAQKAAMQAQAMQNIRAQSAAMQADLTRTQAAQGGMRTGADRAKLSAVAGAAGAAQGKVATDIERISAEQAAQQKARALANVKAKKKELKEDWKQGTESVQKSMDSGSMMGGGGGGGSSGGGGGGMGGMSNLMGMFGGGK